MSELFKQLHQALIDIEQYAGLSSSDYSATRLGGLTNLVFKLQAQSEKAVKLFAGNLVMRIPGEGTEEYIDRSVEAHNATIAAELGVSSEILYSNPQSGVMLSRYIEDAITMTPDLFASRDNSPGRAGKALRILHNSQQPFRFRFELFEMIDNYLDILSKTKCQLPDGYHDVIKAAEPVKMALLENPGKIVPSHCDPLCENFLDDGTKMWIVDWEYSGMNDSLWDLGDLSVEGGFSAEQDLQMLWAYYAAEPNAAQIGRMVIYKAMCDLLWTLWGLIQHANKNPADDFWAYAIARFERCKGLMEQDIFVEHLKAISGSSLRP